LLSLGWRERGKRKKKTTNFLIFTSPHFRKQYLNIVNQHQIVKDNPVNLSILITGGKETNKDA